jgi:hypothetical protein
VVLAEKPLRVRFTEEYKAKSKGAAATGRAVGAAAAGAGARAPVVDAKPKRVWAQPGKLDLVQLDEVRGCVPRPRSPCAVSVLRCDAAVLPAAAACSHTFRARC